VSAQGPSIAAIAATLPWGKPEGRTPPDHGAALEGLNVAEAALGAGYAMAAAAPLRAVLEGPLKRSGWDALFSSPLAGGDLGSLVFDAVSALSGEADLPVTRALHEVICDYHDGFASCQDRAGVALAVSDRRPPLPFWTQASATPYAYGRVQVSVLGLGCGLVAVPQVYARGGVSAWCVIAHETAGHGLLEGEPALRSEAASLVAQTLAHLLPELASAIAPAGANAAFQEQASRWATYWPSVVEETLADLIGVLNQGPAAAGGAAVLLSRAITESAELSGEDHPHAALRLFVMAEGVRQTLQSPDDPIAAAGDETAEAIAKALAPDWLNSLPLAVAAARIVARALISQPLACLGRKPLSAVQRWRPADEALVLALAGQDRLPTDRFRIDIYAAHIVAAAWRRSWSDDAAAFAWMVEGLNAMRALNPIFGPLPVELPGDLAPHRHSSPVPIPPIRWSTTPPNPAPPPVPSFPITWPPRSR
jgi:hypothetical protein